jgi:hypothetical protein
MKANHEKDQVTDGLLVVLANKRILSMVFERAWQERTGVNPVETLIQQRQFLLQKRGWFRALVTNFAMLCFLTILFFASGPYSWGTSIVFASGFGIFMYVATASDKWLANKFFPVYSGMSDFLVDLIVLCRWLHELMPAETLSVLYEDHVKKAVHDRLTGLTREILEIEKRPTLGYMEYLAAAVECTDKRKDLAAKHDLCVRIGLASGSFDKWFEVAKRQMRQEAKKAKATAPV